MREHGRDGALSASLSYLWQFDYSSSCLTQDRSWMHAVPVPYITRVSTKCTPSAMDFSRRTRRDEEEEEEEAPH